MGTRLAYAAGTEVTPDRSQAEIARLVSRYGARSFATGWDQDRAIVTFIAHGRQVRFSLPLPTLLQEYMVTESGRRRDKDGATRAMQAEIRRRWRALAMVIKAKLELLETGVATFEEEFLPYVVLPNGRTVAEETMPAVQAAIERGAMPDRVLAIGPGR
jgi:hypothetical protein